MDGTFDLWKFAEISERKSIELSEKLKRCPFCGGSAKIIPGYCILNYTYGDLVNGEIVNRFPIVSTSYEVECENRCAKFEKRYKITFKSKDALLKYNGPEEIVNEWNKRKK